MNTICPPKNTLQKPNETPPTPPKPERIIDAIEASASGNGEKDIKRKRPHNYKNIVGAEFGKLTVKHIHRVTRKGLEVLACECRCGKELNVFKSNLLSGHTNSCGCARIGKKLVDMVGQKYGRLTVLSRSAKTDSSGNAYWKCACSCGSLKIVEVCRGKLLKKYTASCGCLLRDFRANQFLGKGVSGLNLLFRQYKYAALKRKITFELTKDMFSRLTKQNCFYCGSAPRQKSVCKINSGAYIYNGIDRVDNQKGYTLDNSVPCCGLCNRMKSDLTKNQFISHIEAIYKYCKSYG